MYILFHFMIVDLFLVLTTSFNELGSTEVFGNFGIASSLPSSCSHHAYSIVGFEQLLIISHFA